MKPNSRMSARLRWGLKWGCTAALFFAVWATFVRLSSGRGPFEELGIPYSAVVLSYIAFGVGGGLVLGLLQPFALKSRTGAALTGGILAFLLYAGYSTIDGSPPWRWSGFMWTVHVIVSGFVGGIGGVVHWNRYSSEHCDNSTSSTA